ncbi:DEAD/DEAH box helicase [soil metagenome]
MAAPTGAGKTVVGEFAAYLALTTGGRAFYTTPIKALSNQKYADFVTLHGAVNVGLLTGDNSLNPDAPIVVMTTEVLRNMIYEDSRTLDDLRYVVLDEVHYLQDRYRGAVWEEILIHLPVEVVTVSLSATLSNTDEFAAWLNTLRGEVEVVIEDRRPVEIHHAYMAGDELLPMFVAGGDGVPIPNPRAFELERRRHRGSERPGRGGRRPRQTRLRPPLRSDVVQKMRSEAMLPAIYFIFSRRGCDDAVRQLQRDGMSLTTSEERRVIAAYAEERVADLLPADLGVLGYDEWIEGLRRGIAAHHAGMIPPFKETVEELFKRGLVKTVFATETLALGINMPARTVVIESLMKFTGEKHELMTPGLYTQLSGRAGRRGIDELGHCIVLMQRYASFESIARLAAARKYPLISSFTPSYNMAVNLVRSYDRSEAEHVVNSSFAQFQADREIVTLEQSRERLAAYLASYRNRMRCDRGDIEEYRALREQVHSSLDSRAASSRPGAGRRIREAIAALRPGDVVFLTSGRRRGRYAVLEVSRRRSEREPRVMALGEDRTLARFAPGDFSSPPQPVGRVAIPSGFHVRTARDRRRLARSVAGVPVPAPGAGNDRVDDGPGDDGDATAGLEEELDRHPCGDCPELNRHLHFADRAARLEREIAGVERRMRGRGATLARDFERVLAVLAHLEYVQGWELTYKGAMLARVYNESDLLVIEMLHAGVLDDLAPPEIAAVCSTLVYEARGADVPPPPPMPTRAAEVAWRAVKSLWRDIHRDEDEHGVDLTREPDPGFAPIAHDWAAGAALDEVLDEDQAAGDFVRSVKQLVDLLGQLEEVTESPALGKSLRAAIASLHRGVVAYSSLEV